MRKRQVAASRLPKYPVERGESCVGYARLQVEERKSANWSLPWVVTALIPCIVRQGWCGVCLIAGWRNTKNHFKFPWISMTLKDSWQILPLHRVFLYYIYRPVFQSYVVSMSRSFQAQGILVALSISVFWFCRHSSICAQVRLTEYTKIRCKMISYEPKMLVKSNWPLPLAVPLLPSSPPILSGQQSFSRIPIKIHQQILAHTNTLSVRFARLLVFIFIARSLVLWPTTTKDNLSTLASGGPFVYIHICVCVLLKQKQRIAKLNKIIKHLKVRSDCDFTQH